MKKNNTVKVAVCALLVALDILLTRVAAINTPVMKIGLGFLAVALASCLYGPWWGAATGALGDFLGSLIFPTGAYFPGFTVTAALSGVIFGLVLYNKEINLKRGFLAAFLHVVIVTYLINTAMIAYISQTPYVTLLEIRAIQGVIMIAVETVCIGVLLPVIERKVRNITDRAR